MSPTIKCVASGDLISTTATAFRSQIDQQLGLASKQGALGLLELDLSAAKMVDSVGLNLLVSVIKGVKEKGGTVRIVIAHQNIQRILAFTRIDKHAEVQMQG